MVLDEIKVLYNNYSDTNYNNNSEKFIEKKKKYIAKILEFFTKFLKRNKFIILKNSN